LRALTLNNNYTISLANSAELQQPETFLCGRSANFLAGSPCRAKIAMPNFDQFLYELGNLHDCSVLGFDWRPFDQTMTFEIRDIHWNFEGLPEYRGPTPGKIVLLGVREPTISLGVVTGPLRISDFEVGALKQDGSGTAFIRFWHGGTIEAPYQRADFPVVPSQR
jgi:hypothetical protein